MIVDVDECIRIDKRSKIPSEFAPDGRLLDDFLPLFLPLLDLRLLLLPDLLLPDLLLPDFLPLFLDFALLLEVELVFDFSLLLFDFLDLDGELVADFLDFAGDPLLDLLMLFFGEPELFFLFFETDEFFYLIFPGLVFFLGSPDLLDFTVFAVFAFSDLPRSYFSSAFFLILLL